MNQFVVGILYPGYSAEDDYPTMEKLLGEDVLLPLVHTELKSDDHTPEAMKAAGDPDVLEKGAKELASKNLNSIIWACTSGSFAWGWDDARKQVKDLEKIAGVPASSTSFAFVDAAKHLGLKRVAIAATYPENLAVLFKTFLQKADIEVVQLASKGVFTAFISACTFSNVCLVCVSMSSAMAFIVGSTPTCPEQKRNPFATIA